MKGYRSIAAALSLLFLCLTLLGCGDSNVFSSLADDDSASAQQDKGIDAINSGDYDTAILLLEDLNEKDPSDPEVIRYLASAYVGLAGFDTLELISILDDDDTNGNDEEMFDAIGELFGVNAETGRVPGLDDKINNLNSALTLLAPVGEPDSDNLFQAGLYGAVQTVLLVMDIFDGQSIDTIKNLSDNEIDTQIEANFDEKQVSLNSSLRLLDLAAEDLVSKAAGETNDLADDMNKYLVDIGYAENNEISAIDLADYLKSL